MILKKNNVERIVDNPVQERRLKAQGYHEVGGSDKTAAPDPVLDLDEMNVEQLRELAKQKGLTGAGALTKAELLEELREVDGHDGD